MLVNATNVNSAKVQSLNDSISLLRGDIQGLSPYHWTQGQLQKLVAYFENIYQRTVEERVLKALAFQRMDERFDQVPEAHAKTFQWILERSSTTPNE